MRMVEVRSLFRQRMHLDVRILCRSSSTEGLVVSLLEAIICLPTNTVAATVADTCFILIGDAIATAVIHSSSLHLICR